MEAAATQPHGHLVPFATKTPAGSKMRARATTDHPLPGSPARSIEVGDIFVSLPVAATTQETTTTATDYTKTGMATLDETGVRGVIQTPPPEIGVTATYTHVNFARAFVILAAQNSPVKPYHGMTEAQIATVNTVEPIPGSNTVRLAAIDSDVRATCGRAIVLAKVFLPSGVTTLIAGTPLIVYGTEMCSLASAVLGEAGARVVGYLHRALTGVADAVTLAEVDFDGDHGFGMVVVNPTP